MTVVTYCPYCASEDLWPQAEPKGAWVCHSCTRAFVVTKAKPAATVTVEDPQTTNTTNEEALT